MKGWACCVLICHQQKRTFGSWRTSSRDLAYFRVSCDIFYVHRGSGQARVYPRRWLSLSSQAKAFTLQGRHRRFVGDSAFHTSLRGAPRLIGEQRSGITRFCKKYRIWCHMTAYHRVLYIPGTVVQQYALVDYYCCFHLTSGTSTAVGPSIVHRNRKRFLLSQATLREDFVEKKYQVFDIISLLTILVQVNLSSPVERV